MTNSTIWLLALLVVSPGRFTIFATQDGFERGPDTQVETVRPLTDHEAIQAWEVPPGFSVNLFASYPQIAQPIAGTFDRMGRLWLAENYTYAELPQRFERQLRDRVLVLSDTTGTGQADQVSVFTDQVQMLASVEVGMGGVWLLCAPQLLFIPDADLDGRPDGPPQVVLDGFEDQEVGHNLVNGLRWGPDGWLYGRHGIQATSHVGRPGTPPEKRIRLNCCIWRYHPTQQKFEVVTHGTTNPWGHDWDAHGELFFINTVIGHLWHAIPGLHTERMYGEDLRPHLFHLTGQVADHYHWDRRVEAWTQQRDGMTSTTDAAGGGHAHSGLAIYHGYRWPQDYHGDVLTLNFHGRRINQDRLQPLGATYTARHRPDPMRSADPWFRGIDLFCGPDDALYVLDWSDLGECHENDGIHRSSGRIYRFDYSAGSTEPVGTSVPSRGEVVATLAGVDLMAIADLLTDPRPWVWRQARLRLQESAAGFGPDQPENSQALRQVAQVLQTRLGTCQDSAGRFRLLMGWWATGCMKPSDLQALLEHSDPHVRVWAIRLLTDWDVAGPHHGLSGLELGTLSSEQTVAPLLKLAERETNGLVLTYLASALRLMTTTDRWQLARVLVRQGKFSDDRVFPYLLWYGLEPSISVHAADIHELLQVCELEPIRRFVARRLAIEYTYRPDAMDSLLSYMLAPQTSVAARETLAQGLAEGWRGWSDLPPPPRWDELMRLGLTSEKLAGDLAEVATTFATGRTVGEQWAIIQDEGQALELRRAVIRSLMATLNRTPPSDWMAEQQQVIDGIAGLQSHRFLSDAAAQALGQWSHPAAAEKLLAGYAAAPPLGQVAIVAALCQRPERAVQLLHAIEVGSVPRAALSPAQLRQLQLLGEPEIAQRMGRIWPDSPSLLGRSEQEQIQALQKVLSPERIATGDLIRGQFLYQQQCGKCHRLFGQGERLGPELTGGQRGNLNYWLQNIVAPSAEVSSEYRLSLIIMNDGRTLSGVVTQRTPASLVLVSQEASQLLKLSEIEAIRALDQSLMPTGLLDPLSDEDKVHLFAYLMQQAD